MSEWKRQINFVGTGTDIYLQVGTERFDIDDYQLANLLMQGIEYLKHQATWRTFKGELNRPPIRETS